MKLLILSNYLSHHQKPLSDELFQLLGKGNFYFVCTEEITDERKRMGWPEYDVPYSIQYNNDTRKSVEVMISSFDVVVYAQSPLSLVKKRYLSGQLTLCYSERRYKTITRYLKFLFNTYKSFYINRGYLLSSSAFAPKDYWISGMSLRKCFRWGYFPELKLYEDINSIIEAKGHGLVDKPSISILWAGRLVSWKHPEIAIEVALKMKAEGIPFNLFLIGNGVMEPILRKQILDYKLNQCVHLLGSMPPSEVRLYMEKSDIFILTSDRQEGWGAVLNESMNSACAVVVSDAVGSAPYLINETVNGMTFNSGDVTSLYRAILFLIENPQIRRNIQREAYHTISKTWSPKNAAQNLLALAEALLQNKPNPIKDGPGSQAQLYFDKCLF